MTASPTGIAICAPLVVSVGVIIVTIIIHGLAILAIIHFVLFERRLGRAGIHFWGDVAIVTATTLLAFLAHLLEMSGWALIFMLCGQLSHFAPAFYHSAVNYTALGYGDVVMSAQWKLLGPLETADGMLMFGVSTAMVFAVIQRLAQTRIGQAVSNAQ